MLTAVSDVVPNRVDKLLDEALVDLRRAALARLKELPIGALHHALLQAQHVGHVLVPTRRWGEHLQLGVELGQAVLHEQAQQVEPEDGVLLLRGLEPPRRVGVVCPQLQEVALESARVTSLHGQGNGLFKHLAPPGTTLRQAAFHLQELHLQVQKEPLGLLQLPLLHGGLSRAGKAGGVESQ